MFNSTNKDVIFYHIHPLNLIYAFILSFFYKVYFFKSEFVNNFFLKLFYPIDIENIYKYGQFDFNPVLGNAYDDFKKILGKKWENYNVSYSHRDVDINFSNSVLSNIIIDYENLYKFSDIVSKFKIIEKKSVIIFLPGFYKDLYNLGFKIEFENHVNKIKKYYVLDFLLEKFLFYRLCLVILVKILIKFQPIKNFKKKYKILWQGISPQELNKLGKKNSFYFCTDNKKLSSETVLFVLPVYPKEELIKELSIKKINWIVKNDQARFVSIKEFIFFITELIFSSNQLNYNTKYKCLNFRLKKCMLEGYLGFNFLKKNNFKIYVTNNSDLEVAGYEMSVARALKVKTIMWQYSQAGVIPCDFSKKKYNNNFCGRLVQSILFADFQFMWSKDDVKLFKERNLQPHKDKPDFYVTGPTMMGRSNWLTSNTKELRSKIFNKRNNNKDLIWISIFDYPSMSNSFKKKINFRAGAERFTVEMQEIFFNDLILLLHKFKNIGFIYKPKRPESLRYIQSNSLKIFLNKTDKSIDRDRIILLPNNIDPYIPISAADYAIGVPFTSQVFLGKYIGKDSIFYDSTNLYKSCYPRKCEEITVHNYIELIALIEKWIYKKNIIKVPHQNIIDSPVDNLVDNILKIGEQN